METNLETGIDNISMLLFLESKHLSKTSNILKLCNRERYQVLKTFLKLKEENYLQD